jgi:ribosome biogenesis GTPase
MATDAARDSSKAGLVIAAHGRRGMLETTDGGTLPYVVRGRRLQVCCGDHVHWQAFSDGDPVVVSSIVPRRNQLSRQPARGSRAETIAANISHLVVVMAALPAPDLFITDRYLCAAHLMGAKAAIAWNKADLAALPEAELAVYSAIGYPVFPVSAATGSGLEALLNWFGRGIGLLVGQSGVGKSSLLNRLVPGSNTATGSLSAASDEGRHTTTASIMYRLDGGGRLIDTPGVRDFIPAVPDIRDIAHGFVEIGTTGRDCRFADCSHLREPDCAVSAAVLDGRIDGRRHESYRRLMNLAGQAAEQDY